jgi:MoCo/4Fe-4S cofactor protein with predicted Tat translocation signal
VPPLKPEDGSAPAPPALWRSLEELARTPEFQDSLAHEFPWRTSEEEEEGINRRDFWKVMSAGLALAGLAGCTKQPPEKIVPYVTQPPEITQGVPLFYATAMPFDGDALGLVVKSHMGHPIKAEGNPRHPASLGGTDFYSQASLMTLYDPERSQAVLRRGQIADWISFMDTMGALLGAVADRGARIRLLTGAVNSPTLARQIDAFLKKYPEARWHQWEAVNRDGVRLGSRMAFGEAVNPIYRFDRADVILVLDADFVFCGPGNVRYARDFATRRGSRAGQAMNRMYVVETSPTNTGASADHRLALRQGEMEAFLRGIAQTVGATGGAPPLAAHAKWIAAVSKDLQRNGASLVVVGDQQPPLMHALAHAINAALGNVGNTVVYTEPVEANPISQRDSIVELAADMRAGKVDMLFMLGVNPVYDAPADLDFAAALRKVKHSIHTGLYADETAALCEWHIPQTHFLEEWSDCRAFDGTASIVQPLIAPLYQGRSRHEMMALLLGQADTGTYDIVRATWRTHVPEAAFDEAWRRWLFEGVIDSTTFQPKQVALTRDLAARLAPSPATAAPQGMEIVFRPDPTIWDGRYANNGYLQEIPKGMSKLTWDAVAMVSPNTARKIGTYSQGVVELNYHGRALRFPLWVQPGHADDSVTIFLGYGRTRAGKTGNTGYNAYPLRTSDALLWGSGLTVRGTGKYHRLACTQNHQTMDGRYPVRMGTLTEFQQDPEFAHKPPFFEQPANDDTLYPPWPYNDYKWGMSIDLNACVGCNACVAACEMENNIAVVGKEEVFRGRIMHWIRLDRYHQGDAEVPRFYVQPVPCMHCENAPCELVCPVGATLHSSEGLNQMIYNRCVGTRYCSNNCPYKVRRFNFFRFTDWEPASLTLMRNPEVTPRGRGVMEKCTYCVQRIEHAKITAEKEDRKVRDGEILTACQQACPTQAIVFGDLNDKNSRVTHLKQHTLDYGLLAELNTRPRTSYLARVLNLNPELETELT